MTTCAEFLASDAVQDRAQVLAFLEQHLTAEEFASYNNDAIPDIALTSILKGKAEEIDKRIAEQKLREEAEGAWDKHVQEGDWDDAAVKVVRAKVKGLGNESSLSKPKGKGTVEGRWKLTLYNPTYVSIAVQAIEAEKKRIISEALEEAKPKTTGGARKAKMKDEDYEIKYLGDKENPQGKEYKFFLESEENCDAECVIAKDQKIHDAVDGAKPVKEKRWKAVRKNAPFAKDGTCSAAITWDRAGGSDVLKEFGIQGSFRMCCSEAPEEGSRYCERHLKSKEKKGDKFEDFYDGEYKVGKAKGMAWVDFLTDCCGECAVQIEQ
tara:strand:- start:8 stop:976 length:969 start_codon:yes stop_codon:yes gene_type:complete